MTRPTKVIASALGLTAFAVATIAGMAVGNPSETVLWHAIISMIICQLVGLAIGSIAERVIYDAIDEYQRRHPIPRVQQELIVAEPVEEDPEASPERSAA